MAILEQAPLFTQALPQRPRDELFEAVADECVPGWRQGLTSAARGALNRAVGELRGIQVSASEVGALIRAYRRVMPTATLTPSALAKHAPALRVPAEHRNPLQPREIVRCRVCKGLVGIDCSGHG